MFVGYARVSTVDQNLDLQQDALLAAKCERIFTDTASGAKAQRPGLTEALQCCRPGDTLVVWKLDRLGRSLPHLVETVRDLIAERSDSKAYKKILIPPLPVVSLFFIFSLRWPSLSGTSSAKEPTPGFHLRGHAAEKAAGQKGWMKKNVKQRWH